MSACEEDVLAPPDLDMPFSMYGILNPQRPVQTIAVSPIEPLLNRYPDSLDAVVSSTDLQSGDVVIWKDSVTTGERGQTDHIYWAELLPEYGRDYLVEVERSDGATSSAVASIPEQVEVSHESSASQFLDIYVSGNDLTIHRAYVVYAVRGYNIFISDVCETDEDHLSLDYDIDPTWKGDGYRIRINLEKDHFRLRNKYNMSWIMGISRLALTEIKIVVLIGDPSRHFVDTLRDVSVNIFNTSSNVKNGFGFVSGTYEHEYRAFPSKEVVDASEFFDFMLRPPAECLDYCRCRDH